MAEEIKYPIGIQSFSEIITGGYVYADKTMYVRKMIEGGKYYFLSRPRRFGKSLFLSTLQAYFEGRRDLFKGLVLDTDEIDWTPRPVIKFSFNAVRASEKENLGKYLDIVLSEYEDKYGVPKRGDYSDRFASVIRSAHEHTGQKVTVLVDEYDSLLLDTIRPEHSELNAYYREILKSLFTVLKNADEHIFLAFITGVSRFSHTSLFSGANNLNDISLSEDFDAICGITEEELKQNFKNGIRMFALKNEVQYEDILKLLKDNYDGYHFSETCEDIYNPFSLMRALKSKEIENYWFQSGTPSFLIELIKQRDFHLPTLDFLDVGQNSMVASDPYPFNSKVLLYQTGYLTIKEYEEEAGIYTLGFPNIETERSYLDSLLPIFEEYHPMAKANR